VRLQLRKLALPETEHIGGYIAESRDLADTEVELIRDLGPGRRGVSSNCLVLRHARAPERGLLPSGKYRTAQKAENSVSFEDVLQRVPLFLLPVG
jgi:hypothetical protein